MLDRGRVVDSTFQHGSGGEMTSHVRSSDLLSAEEVRAELARILASPAFSHSPRLASFLRFVVEFEAVRQGRLHQELHHRRRGARPQRRLRSARRSDRARGGGAAAQGACPLLRRQRRRSRGSDRSAARKLCAGVLPPADSSRGRTDCATGSLVRKGWCLDHDRVRRRARRRRGVRGDRRLDRRR